jgi:hypothetical protein
MLFLPTFHADMERSISLWILCDHTFKLVANIGFCWSVMAAGLLCSGVFFVMRENGEVLHWRFSQGESF